MHAKLQAAILSSGSRRYCTVQDAPLNLVIQPNCSPLNFYIMEYLNPEEEPEIIPEEGERDDPFEEFPDPDED